MYPYLPSIGILHVKGIFSLQRLSSQQPFGLLMLHATQFSRVPPSACTGTHTCLWNLSPSNHLKRPSCKLSCRPSNDTKERGRYNELVLIRGSAKFWALRIQRDIKVLSLCSFGVIWNRISDPRSVWTMVHQRNRRIHSGRSPLPGACISHHKPMQRHFYRPVNF